MRCSFGTLSHFGGLRRHWLTRCHSRSRLGVTVWHPDHMSFRADLGVLLQHSWNWFFSTSLSYSRSRCIIVTPQLVADVLHVPRVEHPDYPKCEHLRAVSKDKMIFAFWELPSDWGDRQFTPCKTFARGPRFLNMVMTFVLHPLSHYNSITEPRARFLLSLLEHLTIDFPTHFILSIIDVYRDMTTYEKLIFPLAITWILCHFFVPFPFSNHFPAMCAIDYVIVKWSEVQFQSRQSSTAAPPTPSAPSTSAPSSSMSGVTL